MTDAQRKLKPADVGYFGKGVPDFMTLAPLQAEFARKKLESGLLSVETLEMHRRMNELELKGDPKSRSESLELAKVLLPRLHFLVDDVDWGHELTSRLCISTWSGMWSMFSSASWRHAPHETRRFAKRHWLACCRPSFRGRAGEACVLPDNRDRSLVRG